MNDEERAAVILELRTELLKVPQVQKIAALAKKAWLLKFNRIESNRVEKISTFSGVPFIANGIENPICDHCQCKTRLLLQLDCREFEGFDFSDGTDLFCLFRCTSETCYERWVESVPSTFYWRFAVSEKSLEQRRELLLKHVDMFPMSYELEFSEIIDDPDGVLWEPIFEEQFGEAVEDWVYELEIAFQPTPGNKVGGFPSCPYREYPDCCGKTKDLFLQLSYFDNQLPSGEERLGLNKADLYLFYCKTCGFDSLEVLCQ